MALRTAILKHMSINVIKHPLVSLGCMRSMSTSHGIDKKEVTERVLKVIKMHPKLDPSKVTPTSHFEKDLGLDSLDTVEIVFALEEEFCFQMPDMEANLIDSCDLAIDYIAAHPAVM